VGHSYEALTIRSGLSSYRSPVDLTLGEIDEALEHLRAIPAEERGPAWSAYSDSLLEQRRALVGPPSTPAHETRVVTFSEKR
jgi:hypothetical protein